MRYLTDRKRAAGLGSAKTGTEHHWQQMISSAALVPLMIAFVFTFGVVLGRPYEEVLAYYQNPLPAAVAALTFAVGFLHFRRGAQVMIEDYTGGMTRKALVVGVVCLSYAAAALAILSVARIAF